MNKVLQFLVYASAMILVAPAFAFAEAGGSSSGEYLAIGVGLAVGLAGLGGTLGQGKAVSSALDSVGRNPSAAGKLLVPMLLGLAFIESLVLIIVFISGNGLTGIAKKLAGLE